MSEPKKSVIPQSGKGRTFDILNRQSAVQFILTIYRLQQNGGMKIMLADAMNCNMNASHCKSGPAVLIQLRNELDEVILRHVRENNCESGWTDNEYE